MIIDAHTHIFPEAIQNDRESYFPGEDAFKLLYSSPKAKIVGVEALIETMDAEGVDVSVVFGFPWKNGDIATLNNDYIIDAVARYPERLKGFACFDMDWDGAAEETLRCLDRGLCGVGELAFYLSGIDDRALERLAPVMEICHDRGNLPVMIHTNEPVGHVYPGKTPVTIEQIYALAERFPENRIILAHWGGGILFYHLLKRKAKKVLENIWYDTAAAPFLYDPAIYDVARDTSVLDRVLMGTDYPLLKPSRYFRDLDESGLLPEECDRVKGRNAASLLGIG